MNHLYREYDIIDLIRYSEEVIFLDREHRLCCVTSSYSDDYSTRFHSYRFGDSNMKELCEWNGKSYEYQCHI